MRDLAKDAEEAGDWDFLSHERLCELVDEKCRRIRELEQAREVPAAKTFEEAFAETGYQYGDEEKEGVRLGWELAQGSLLAQRQQPPQAVWTREMAERLEEANDYRVADLYEAGLKVFGSVCPSVPPQAGFINNDNEHCLEVLQLTAERDAALRDLAEAREQLAAKEAELQKLRDGGKVLVAANTRHFNSASESWERAESAERALADTKARLAKLQQECRHIITDSGWSDDVNGGVSRHAPVYVTRLHVALTETAEPAPQPDASQQAFRDGYVLALSKVRNRWDELRNGVLVPRICDSDMWRLIAEMERDRPKAGDDYDASLETRDDGQRVPRKRWEDAYRAVISRFTGAREQFEIEPTMWRAIKLVELGLEAEKPSEPAPQPVEPAKPQPVEVTPEEFGAAVAAAERALKIAESGHMRPDRKAQRQAAKPQVTLEALAAQVARLERALRMALTTLYMLDVNSDEATGRIGFALSHLDTDAAEAGKGEM